MKKIVLVIISQFLFTGFQVLKADERKAREYNIGGKVFLDSNKNGTKEYDEIGISGVGLSLEESKTTTDKKGNFLPQYT